MYALFRHSPRTFELRMRKMTFKLLGLAVIAIGLSGCNGGRKAPPDTIVRATNVVPSYAGAGFRRAEAPDGTLVSLAYKGSAQAVYNEDTYDFHLEAQHADEATPTRIVNFTKQVLAGTTYDFVFTEAAGTPGYTILEMPTPGTDATDAEVIGLHAADGTPSVDAYLVAPGTDVTAGVTPWGTVGFGETLPVQNVATGQYELVLTEAGNPANALLTTGAFTLAAGSTTSLIIAPEAGAGVATLSVLFVQDSSQILYDKDVQAGIRVINAATDKGARDVVVNGDYTTPLFPAVAFGTQSAYQNVPVGTVQLNVTPAGNSGSIEFDQALETSPSQLYTVLFAGDAGTLTEVVVPDDHRPIPGQATFRILDAAPQFTTLDFFLVKPGTDITTVLPATTLAAPGSFAFGPIAPATYDLVVRDTTSGTIVAGPQSLTFDSTKFYTVLAVNGASSSSADVILLDDFN